MSKFSITKLIVEIEDMDDMEYDSITIKEDKSGNINIFYSKDWLLSHEIKHLNSVQRKIEKKIQQFVEKNIPHYPYEPEATISVCKDDNLFGINVEIVCSFDDIEECKGTYWEDTKKFKEFILSIL